MPTVLDEFVIELGLDPKKLTQGQQQAIGDFRKFIENQRRAGNEAEAGSKKIVESIGSIKRAAIGLTAAIFGAKGLADFVSNTVQAGANVGRLSRAIGVSANEISRWQGVARTFGSTAENMAASFASMSDVFTAWQIGGPEAPAIMQVMRTINTEAERLDAANAKVIDSGKGVNQFYLDLADNLKIIHDRASDPNLARYLAGRFPNMDPGMFDALIQGSAKLSDNLRQIQGWTDADAEAAGRLQRRWDALKVSAENWSLNKLFGVMDFATKAWNYQITGGRNGWEGSPQLTQPSVNSTAVGGSGRFGSNAEREAFIRAEAARQGQNPDVWAALFAGEGKGSYFGDYDATGKPTSFGALQLHYPGVGRNTADGLGTLFTRETGLDARDPATERQQIVWGMNYARTHGLGDWHGWHGSQFANLQGGSNVSHETTVSITGPITINAGPNADASDIAQKLRDVGLKRAAEANQSSVGAQ